MISSIFPVSLPYLQSTDYLYYPPLYYCVFPSQILRNLFQSSCSSLIRPLSKLNSIEDDRDVQTMIAESCIKYFKSYCIVTTGQRLLEKLLSLIFGAYRIRKLVKNIGISAVRKCQRYTRWLASQKMFFTTMRANLLYEVSFVLIGSYNIHMKYLKDSANLKIQVEETSKTKKDAEMKSNKNYEALQEGLFKRAMQDHTKNIATSMIHLVASSVGAAIGTFLLPGLGTLSFSDFVVSLVFFLLGYGQNEDIQFIQMDTKVNQY